MEFMGDKFPEGLHVLAVDDNAIFLEYLEALLKECRYQVTTTSSAESALDLLRKNKKTFDIVLADIEMDGGLRLLGIIRREMDMPVIMMTTSKDCKLLIKGKQQGACDYQVKPPSLRDIRNIWQHVVIHRKNKFNFLSDLDIQKPETQRNFTMPCNNQAVISNEDEAGGSHSSDSDKKTTRFSWDQELHEKFVEAFNKLGDKAYPSSIVKEMNVPGLTRKKVGSHLQKYRMMLERQGKQSIEMSGHLRIRSFRNLEFKNRMDYLSRLKSYNPGMSQSNHDGASTHSIINPQPQFHPSTQQYTSQFSSAPGTFQRQ